MSYERKSTREVRVGNVKIGGNNPISVQSMTNTDTRDVEKTVEQIKRLEKAGCDIVRVAVVDMDAAKSISKIKEQINIPIIADIHFDYKLALEAINQ
ncbi:flavodoxin-dependent (E)-4-hydroxy-3-methylbut-2-enyl-diphosphate synthase, partial [Intestinibacter sp.]|uniref:flavodoxin-dependent (E)-4-hydroxy-3-methylbut-2-enyl-diphosphate synthase n=1 Tax=Intestinibacter sp. TaxID=1965304 RepID=UPI003F1685CF